MKKGISVIIPTYNRERYVADAIQSVLNQNYEGPLEIIVSDDGSTDNTINIVQTFKSSVTLVCKPSDCKTQGAASTRTRGIKSSTQSLICFLDSDDFYLPGHLNRIAAIFEKEPYFGFAFCRILEVREENDVLLFKPWTSHYILKNDIKNPVISRNKIVHTNSFMFRREVFDNVGYFNENYTNGEDGDLWMRISEKYKGKFVDHFGAAYRSQHGNEQLTKNSNNRITNCSLLIFKEAKKRYYKLNLNDKKRIFKIKYTLIWLKYRKQNINLFLFKYLVLICQYPTGFFQKILQKYLEKKENKHQKDWNKLEEYTIVLNP